MRFLDRYVAQAKAAPDAPAIIDDQGIVSRAALLGAAAIVARDLRAETPAVTAPPVGIALPKSAGAAAAMLGALLAGRAYVPLDPALPDDRRGRMITDSGMDVIFVADELEAARIKLFADLNIVVRTFDPGDHACLSLADELLRNPSQATADAAILYTSGSTSQPKGVRLSRGAIDVFLDWAQAYFELGPDDVTASHAPFGFDISLLDLFGGLGAGACVALVPEGQMANGRFLIDFVTRHHVTFWQSTPTALTALVGAASECRGELSLRHVCATGEALPITTRRALGPLASAGTATKVLFHNIYGCTETNDSFVHTAPMIDVAGLPGEVETPVGRPLPFISWRVVDDNLAAVADGAQGELLVASGTAFTGYTDPALTTAAHVEIDGVRYYRTRDLVRVEKDGNLRFFGRVDHTVKLRGVRVDLREIESCLAAYDGVRDPVAFLRECPKKGRVLVCGFNHGDAQPSLLALKQHCARHLPRQTIPDILLPFTPTLSRNVNGKVDRHAAIAAFAAVLDSRGVPASATKEKNHAHQF